MDGKYSSDADRHLVAEGWISARVFFVNLTVRVWSQHWQMRPEMAHY